eukprot:5134635-Amphidinium_carterae.1
MDTARDSDLLEQHNTLPSEVEMPGANALGSFPAALPADPDALCLTDNVPGQPAALPEQEQPAPLPSPGQPVARTGFQAATKLPSVLTPMAKGCHSPCTQQPGLVCRPR